MNKADFDEIKPIIKNLPSKDAVDWVV